MKKTNKILAIILAIVTVLAMMPMAAFAATNKVIDTVELKNFNMPVADSYPDHAVNVPAGKGYNTMASSGKYYVEWRVGSMAIGETYKIKADEIYNVSIGVRCDSGYEFASNVTVTLDGKPVAVALNTGNQLIVALYDLVPSFFIGKIEITDLAAPVICETPDFDASVPAKKGYSIKGLEWCGEGSVKVTKNDKFTANQQYAVTIAVACDENGMFATGVTATVNGQTAEVNRLNDKQVIITFEGFETGDCECKCHTGNFFFRIILFFQKLFGMNKVCICGVKH